MFPGERREGFFKGNAMWGNKPGWGISAVIVVMWAAALWLLYNAGDLTPPTDLGRNAAMLARLSLPVAPESLLPTSQAQDSSDAGELYRQALDAYRANQATYDRILATAKPEPQALEGLAAVEAVLKATTCNRMSLFDKHPAEVVRYKEKDAINALSAVGQVTIKRGLILKSQDAPQAERCYEAGFALGAKLFNERLVYEELEAGLGLMSESAQALLSLEHERGHQEQAEKYSQFLAAYREYDQEHIKPIIRALKTVDPNRLRTHVGDVFAFVDGSQERLWRVEALLQLGRYRFNADRAADQRQARRTLKKMVQDPDPVVSLAAQAGRDLTIEEYRTQGAE